MTARAAKASLKLARKQHFRQFCQALYDFGAAHLTRRRVVFKEASVTHEPARLINSRTWGPELFPEAVIQVVRVAATKAVKSLLSIRGRTAFDPDGKRRSRGVGGSS